MAKRTVSRTLRLLPGLLPHRPDIAVGLERVADPRVLAKLIARLRRLVDDHRATMPKSRLTLESAADRRLQVLLDKSRDLPGIPEADPPKLYELANAALLAVRSERLSPTFEARQPLPDEQADVSRAAN